MKKTARKGQEEESKAMFSEKNTFDGFIFVNKKNSATEIYLLSMSFSMTYIYPN